MSHKEPTEIVAAEPETKQAKQSLNYPKRLRASSLRPAQRVFILATRALAFGFAAPQEAFADGICASNYSDGGKSISAGITTDSDGSPVTDGMVVKAGTRLRLDAVATAYGQCDRWYTDTNSACTIHYLYNRTVNHIEMYVDASTSGSFNGRYSAGRVDGIGPDGTTKFYNELDTRSATSTGPDYFTPFSPGTYIFQIWALINTTPCNSQSGTDRTETITITVYVREKGDDAINNGPTTCNANVGEPVNVTNGNMYIQQTDYNLPSVGEGLEIARTYNSLGQTKRKGILGYGWSTAFDESITPYGALSLRLNLPDGRGIFFARSSTSSPFAAKNAPDFREQLVQNADGGYTVTFKDGRVHGFNAAGKLLSMADRNGNQTVLTYDSNGKLVSIMDAAGRTLTLAIGSNGLTSSISDQSGTIATYAYGSSGVLRSVTYPDGSKYVFAETIIGNAYFLTTVKDALNNMLESHTYDAQGRALTSERHGGVERYTLSYVSPTETHVTDALGHVTKYFFDKSKGRNIVTRVEGNCECGGSSRVDTWTYDAQLSVTSKTNALGQTASYTYDADSNPLTVTDALGTTRYTYNQFGQALTTTDVLGGVTTNTYDARGNLFSTKDALNHTTAFTYDGRGLLVSVTDPRNHTTQLTYDAFGNLTRQTNALNHTTNLAYDARGRLTSGTDAANNTTQIAYDLAGRIKTVTQADNSTVTYTYDLAGRRTKLTDGRGNSTTFAYDTAYRLTSQTDAANKTTAYAYDLMSNLTSVTDALGRTTNYTYDEADRLTKLTYPEATTGAGRLEERFIYDAAGRLTQRVDQAGRATSYVYDTSNRLTETTDAALKVTRSEYNARSQPTALIDAIGQRYEFTYDAMGRVLEVRRAGGFMTYAYDAAGNRTRRTDYNGALTNYTYDALNRLTNVGYPNSTGVVYNYDSLSRLTSAANEHGTVTLAYDNRSRLSATTDVWGQSVGYAYDANSNRTGLTLGATTAVSYQYDNLDRLTQLSGSGGVFTFGYDAVSKLTSRTSPNGVATTPQYDNLDRLTRLQHTKGLATVADYQYQLNAVGNITQITEPAGAHAFSYDAVDRLTAATHSSLPSESYTYDAVGNRTASHVTTSYGYQPANRLTTVGPTNYSYDANGNLISKTDVSGLWLYFWDYENRLVQVTRPTGEIVSYKYDALGRRIERAKGATWTRFSYDGTDVVLDRNSDGSTVEYTNGLGIDEKLSLRANGGSALYFVADHLGSTRALTDAAGNVVERTDYDAFGGGAGSLLTRYGFTGRELDADTGLYYYRARWYDPQAGRFLSEDLVGFAGGVNFYAYVNNAPLDLRDPQGLWPSKSLYKVHQEITRRALTGRANARELKILMQEQEDFDNVSQAEAYAPAHAMRRRGQSREAARREANRFVRTHICLARDLAKRGYRNEAMHYLGRAMHTVQDATSPAHANFNEAWKDTAAQVINHIPHYATELFDPGARSAADEATLKIWQYFTGESPMPLDFFSNSYDLKHGRAYFTAKSAPDGGCACR